ncbi:hypothetical protein BH09VER1_BH09VER1_52940 [soil metagenome]
MTPPLKILFVCGRNKRRSPTAEKIFKGDPRMLVRSAGTSDSSKRRITAADLHWADLVLVMQRKYAARIKVGFKDIDPLPPMESLDIGDDYIFMEVGLINILRSSVDEALENYYAEKEAEQNPD